MHLQALLTMANFSVNRIVPSTVPKQIEKTVLREEAGEKADDALGGGKSEAKARRERIVRRAAKELKDGVCLRQASASIFETLT